MVSPLRLLSLPSKGRQCADAKFGIDADLGLEMSKQYRHSGHPVEPDHRLGARDSKFDSRCSLSVAAALSGLDHAYSAETAP